MSVEMDYVKNTFFKPRTSFITEMKYLKRRLAVLTIPTHVSLCFK